MNPETETPLKQIRTFQGDVADALRRQEESLVSIQRREHLRQSLTGSSADASSKNSNRWRKAILFIIGSLVLFMVGTASIWYAYNEFVRKTSTPIGEKPANRFISSNNEVGLEFATTSRESLINTITRTLGDVPPGELRHVVLRQEAKDNNGVLLSTSDFLNRLESRASGSLIRAFNPLFMLGAFGENAFIIIKLASYENAFAGMLLWEKNLAQDIGPLFATAPFLRNLPLESIFTDFTDRNKDIRVLLHENKLVLMYTFFDNKMLIITDNLDTLKALVDRLTQEKLSR